MPANYTVDVTASSGEIVSGHAIEVLAGETAIWATTSTGNVTVASVGVMSAPTTASTVPAVAAITSQRTDFFPDFGLGTEIRGVVTNTGPTPRSFTVELQANTGEVLMSSIADVPASQSATWVALAFHGAVTARIVRVATLHSPP